MKHIANVLLLALLVFAAGHLFGQATQPIVFTAPFAFTVGDQVLPAGEYTLKVPTVNGMLSIVSSDGAHSAFVLSMPIEKLDPETKFKVIFHRYGDVYFVSEIWVPGYRTGRIVLPHGPETTEPLPPQHVTLYAQLRNR